MDAVSMLQALSADRNYTTACFDQNRFAARLDPKPERVKEGERHAVCQYLWSVGNPAVTADALTVLKFHDRQTLAHSEFPLA
jgi:hypothetical protein